MHLLGRALDRLAHWVVGDQPITFDDHRVHLSEWQAERGYGDPL